MMHVISQIMLTLIIT